MRSVYYQTWRFVKQVSQRKRRLLLVWCVVLLLVCFLLTRNVRYTCSISNTPVSGLKYIHHWTTYYARRYPSKPDFRSCAPHARKCAMTQEVCQADAVLFHGFDVWPWIYLAPRKLPHQVWVYYTQEAPATTLWYAERFNGKFNWTMTHQRNSDILMPYTDQGQWITYSNKKQVLKTSSHQKLSATTKTRLAYIVTSNCRTFSKRSEYIEEMQRWVDTGQIEVFGGCGKPCPDKCDMNEMSRQYFFYLSFENSLCVDYITEKYFRNALKTDAVPVVRGGASRRDYEIVSPPNSFIYADDFPSPRKLVEYLQKVSRNLTLYNSFRSWKTAHRFEKKNDGTAVNQHSHPFCRLCAALHNKTLTAQHRVRKNLEQFWSQKNCRDPAFKGERGASTRFLNYFAYLVNYY